MTILFFASLALNAYLALHILGRRKPSNEIAGILLPSVDDERWETSSEHDTKNNTWYVEAKLGSVNVGWVRERHDGYQNYYSRVWIEDKPVDGYWWQLDSYRKKVNLGIQQRKALKAIEGG